MKISDAHLTYCTNIHAGESWEDVYENLRRHVLAVKAQVAPDTPFGVGLRLSAVAARRLREPGRLEELQEFLAGAGLYVFTINGFPYGPFHGRPVKAAVYRPDWSDAERVAYTRDLAEILVALAPLDLPGSVGTVPGGFKPDLAEPEARARVVRQLSDAAVDLAQLERRTGRLVTLALEPEPGCLLETTPETVAFFERELLSSQARHRVGDALGIGAPEAEAVIRRHLGVCLDTCHAAVEFEDADAAVAQLEAAGIGIFKVQLSAGLRLVPSPAALRALEAYDEPVYLHQVVARTAPGELLRFDDLPDALASAAARQASEWRVHFHVPLYSSELGEFTNTQGFLKQLLSRQRRGSVSRQLEVETYAWDVLPADQRTASVTSSIARELRFAIEQLRP